MIDLTANQHLAQPGQQPAALIITEWPLEHLDADTHLALCAAHLNDGGCLAIVVTSPEIPDQLGILVGAARTAGLRYLQHVVVAHRLNPRTITKPRAANGSRRREQHLRVHTDVLLFLARHD